MTKHEWKERTGEETWFYRANHHAGKWELHRKEKGDEFWTKLGSPTEEVVRQLRDVLWRKYQRQRCPHKLVEQVDQWIEELETS